MEVLRYANRVPLQFSPASCAITQTVLGTNWRSYGLSQSRGAMPKGPVTVMVHVASVWVPFTSESKEAIASYPEIQKELRLALQTVGRHLGAYVRKRLKVKQQGERRQIFLRYLGEVATAVSEINAADRSALYDQLLSVAKKRTADADMKLDDRGRPIIDDEDLAGAQNVLIVDPTEAPAAINRTPAPEETPPVEETAAADKPAPAKTASRQAAKGRRAKSKA
jgi:DNA topoisomerase-6 subunit B